MGILGSWKMARAKTQIITIGCIGEFVAFKVQLKRHKHRILGGNARYVVPYIFCITLALSLTLQAHNISNYP